MYCLKKKCECFYTNASMENSSCDYETQTSRSFETCEYFTKDFDKIIKATFSDFNYEEFAKEMLLYENNKYINARIRQILSVCYCGRDINSAMEDIEKVFYKNYALKIIKAKKKESLKTL